MLVCSVDASDLTPRVRFFFPPAARLRPPRALGCVGGGANRLERSVGAAAAAAAAADADAPFSLAGFDSLAARTRAAHRADAAACGDCGLRLPDARALVQFRDATSAVSRAKPMTRRRRR